MLGPSHDGGYYLIGLKQAHPAPFEEITWSSGSVLAETLERCRSAHLETVLLPTWYDVDDAATLDILTAELLHAQAPAFTMQPGYSAPHTARLLAERTAAPELSA